MSLANCLKLITDVDVQAEASKTASFNSTPISVVVALGMVMVHTVFKSVSGTSPTFAVTLQTGDASNGSDAADVDAVNYAIAAHDHGNAVWIVKKSALKKYIRIAATIGGSDTPTLIIVSKAYYFKKYI